MKSCTMNKVDSVGEGRLESHRMENTSGKQRRGRLTCVWGSVYRLW